MDGASPQPGHNRPPGTVVVRLPGVLVDLFPGAPRRLEVPAETVADMIDRLDRKSVV